MSETDGWLKAQVQPRTVPGYEDAKTLGLVQPVPSHPPALAIRPSASSRARTIVAVAVGALVALLILVKTLESWLPQGWPALIVALGGVAVVVGTTAAWARLGRACIREFQHGYTTFEITFGTYWWGTGTSRPGNANRAPWDFSALWLLDGRSGRVIRPPTSQSDPPGMYPSPNSPGALELWSGLTWMRYYEKLPQNGTSAHP